MSRFHVRIAATIALFALVTFIVSAAPFGPPPSGAAMEPSSTLLDPVGAFEADQQLSSANPSSVLTSFSSARSAIADALRADALAAEAAGSPDEQGRYIIILDDPPVASYRGGIQGLSATAVDTAGGKIIDGEASIHLDFDSPAASAYRSYLAQQQDSIIGQLRSVAPELDTNDWRYDLILNGFAAKMSPRSAVAALQLQGVRLIYPAEELIPEMDATKDIIGAVQAWEAAGGTAEAGMGARVAIMEAGNAVLHEFFHDEGMPEPPEGFPSARAYTATDGAVHDLLAISEHPYAVVNNKIIGLRVFAQSMTDEVMERYANGFSLSTHGTHVTGTVSGRHGEYEIRPGLTLEMSGVAPNAWVFNYPFIGEQSPEMIKAFEVMAEEEIDTVNLSLGTVLWMTDGPETHPLSVAMSGAAGNAGINGRTSLSGGWKYSEDLLVVGNTSSNGRLHLDLLLEEAPEDLRVIDYHLRGVRFPESVVGELSYQEDGGCEPTDEVAGKIAVVERFDEDQISIGDCSYNERASIMAESGAVAIVYVYYDRFAGGGSPVPIALPGGAIGNNFGPALVEWLRAGNTTTATLKHVETRDYLGTEDVLDSGSSRGPGLNWSIKPDISAPGGDIISSMLLDSDATDDLPPDSNFWSAQSGTSMSAPHVTGAAGHLRSMHPSWTVDQLRSALINTSQPVITVPVTDEAGEVIEFRQADPTEGGPGRLDLTYAHDPRAFLHPPKASFGAVHTDEELELEITIESASDEAITWDLTVEKSAGDARVRVEPSSVRIESGGTADIVIHMDTDEVVVREQWGDIVLTQRKPEPPGIYLPALLSNSEFGATEGDVAGRASIEGSDDLRLNDIQRDDMQLDDTELDDAKLDDTEQDDEATEDLRRLRLVYYAYVDIQEERDDVLIVDWTYGETGHYVDYYTDALDELGLTYSIWGMGDDGEHPEGVARDSHPTFEEMYRHDLVILNANESQRGLIETGDFGLFQYQNIMLGGGNMLIAGQGTQGWWRYMTDDLTVPLADTPSLRLRFPDTWPYQWLGHSQSLGCEMCITRYFAGYTPGLTSTLSGRLLVPHPVAPDRPEMEVRLARHPEADGPFDYDLDISTGAMAKDGAAGNQYMFNSGSVISGHKPNTPDDPETPVNEAGLATSLGDLIEAPLVQRTVPYARPLWSYPVSISDTTGMTETLNVVGTYVAGKQHEGGPAWNAMYWGFGLEGVGEAGEGSASRTRLMGDTYNFLAKNIEPSGSLVVDAGGRALLHVDLGRKADPVRFTEAQITWGDGREEVIVFAAPTDAEGLVLAHSYGDADASRARGSATVSLIPERGVAAPVHVTIRPDSE